MSSPLIYGFHFTDDCLDKLTAHGLRDWQVEQILGNEHVIVPNRKRRRAQYLVIGYNDGGTCITVPVERTPDPVIWRPITGWLSKESERARLR